MTTTTFAPDRSAADDFPLAGQQHLVLESASWELYQRLLRDAGERNLRVTYDRGRMEIMAPLSEHERPSRSLSMFVMLIAMELNIPVACCGSTTFKLKPKERGLEPDECFYVQNERAVRGRKRLDLRRDPPPDLAIEIEITSRVLPKLPIYAALGIPEVWRYDGKRVTCLQLQRSDYRAAQRSLAFPFLRPRDLTRFLERLAEEGETAVMLAIRDWIAKQEWPRRQ
jgi:Uma2 family endonuclease